MRRAAGIPPRAGWVSCVSLGLLLAACDGDAPAPARAAAPPLDWHVVEPRRVPLERLLDGRIEAVNQGTVAAQTSGRVVEMLYDVNDFVPAGAVIVRLRATEQKATLQRAQATLQEAIARETEANQNYQRASAMFERGLVAKAFFDEAAAARDAARAHLSAARATLASAREVVDYTEVRAPYAGVVTKRNVEVGETVAPGTPLVTGLSLRSLRVAVDVPQSAIEQVRHIGKAVVYVQGRRIAAERLTVFPEADLASNTFRARLELPENATDLYPGMFVKVGFVVGESERLYVPAGTLVEHGEVTAVYVIDDDGRTSLRQLRTGRRGEEGVEVLAGLVAGERIATDPAAALRRLARTADGAGAS